MDRVLIKLLNPNTVNVNKKDKKYKEFAKYLKKRDKFKI